jgi:phosphopantothenoylcysteine decarboxylase/phosphopantothenate--cysteine ligase
VADYRPAEREAVKIKKNGLPEPVRLVENPDILRELSAARAWPGQVLVGFAAETDGVLAHGREKLARKGCDLLVVNRVGGGLAFGTTDNAAAVLAADGTVTDVPLAPKEVLAGVLWDLVGALWPTAQR